MTFARVLGFVLLCLFVPIAVAQQATAPAEEESQAAAPATTFQGADWLSWKKMTGDWGGVRPALADSGITFDIDVTQVLQGNSHGGASTRNGLRYSGSADLTLTLDLGAMGLIPGGRITLVGEPKWGDGINPKVGSLIPVNLDAFKPGAGEGCTFTLSEYFYEQVLFDGKLILLAGKLDGSRAFETNALANNEKT